MNDINFQSETPVQSQALHFGHLGVIALALVLLGGVSYMEKPQLFSFKKTIQVADANVPHYYPYVAPVDDQPQVLGASTDNAGPEIIGDDGTVEPVDMGQVLGASTQGVELSINEIKVNTVADSTASIQTYFTDAQNIESNTINNSDFASALASGDPTQISQQVQKLAAINTALQKLQVPQSLVQLQKLKVIQYNSAIALLQDYAQTNQNPDQINSDLQQFLKSQQDLDTENIADAQKLGAQDPYSDSYLNTDGTPAATQDQITNFGSSAVSASEDTSDDAQSILDNSDASDNSDYGQ